LRWLRPEAAMLSQSTLTQGSARHRCVHQTGGTPNIQRGLDMYAQSILAFGANT
jgi:hypothetical protein